MDFGLAASAVSWIHFRLWLSTIAFSYCNASVSNEGVALSPTGPAEGLDAYTVEVARARASAVRFAVSVTSSTAATTAAPPDQHRALSVSTNCPR